MIVSGPLPHSIYFKDNTDSKFASLDRQHVRGPPYQSQISNEYTNSKKKNSKIIARGRLQRKNRESVEERPELYGNEIRDTDEEDDGRKVHCQVDVISWRERHIIASILVNTDEQTVWDVLTDYERLAEFIPNLVCSERIPCPYPGRIWLMQRGMQRAMYWHIEARVVLDLQEFPHLANGKELHFSMVDGDFKQYEGRWFLRSGPRPKTTILYYEVNVIPRFNFPAIFVERIIRTDLPVNLQALAARAEANSGASLETIACQKGSSLLLPETVLTNTHKNSTSALPVTRLPTNSEKIEVLHHGKDRSKSHEVDDDEQTSTLAKLSTTSINELADISNHWGAVGKTCRLDRPCVVDEVHLRRLDDLLENGGVHRRVIATITIKAPSRKVWNVMTAYESLSEFVPNLAISKIIFREGNKVRLLQEGCKGLLYMVLHARVVLDLWEHPEHEILFEQVEGDFDSFEGKWIFEKLGSQHTLLKYVVETKMQKNCLLAEAIVEEVIYEDLPSNLCAIRDRVEIKETSDLTYSASNTYAEGPQIQNNPCDITDTSLKGYKGSTKGFKTSDNKPSKQRPKVPGLQRDIEILKSELSKFIAEHGREGFMPMRKHLRLHGRVDLEKAITRMGGFRNIAALMNLSLAYKHRKPKGYWDSLENLKQEVSRFQRIWGMDPTYMPSRKSIERAGRFDLARAFEKWGGLHEVSRLLMLKVQRQRSLGSIQGDKVVFKASKDFQNRNKTPYKTYVPHNSNKWLVMHNDMDNDWRE